MKKILLLGFLLLAGSTSYAQKVAPSPTDLKAAYCVKYYQYSVNLIESTANILNKDSPDLYKSHMALLEELRHNLQKLQSYLLPRTKFLELEGLLTAAAQYTKDSALTDSCINQCPNDQQSGACRAVCIDKTGFNNRSKTCNDLSWMPY